MHPRVVVLAPNWLGDAVMALPAIRDMRRHFARSVMAVAARPAVAPLFHHVPGVDDVVTLRGDEARVLREGHYDLALLLPNSFHAAWLARRAGIRERWGYRTDFRRFLLTRSVRRPSGKLHFGAYYQHLAGALGMETGPLTPRIDVPKAWLQAAERLLRENGWSAGRPLVGLAPAAAFGHAKRWPPERYAALIVKLNQAGATCVLLGRADDREAGQAVEAALRALDASLQPPQLLDLIGRTDLAQLMGVLLHCQSVVASDSGALHLAAGLGVPVVAIYGPTDERYSTPLSAREDSEGMVAVVFERVFCRPCFMRDCPIDHRCMKRISPERVLDAVRGQLQRTAVVV